LCRRPSTGEICQFYISVSVTLQSEYIFWIISKNKLSLLLCPTIKLFPTISTCSGTIATDTGTGIVALFTSKISFSPFWKTKSLYQCFCCSHCQDRSIILDLIGEPIRHTLPSKLAMLALPSFLLVIYLLYDVQNLHVVVSICCFFLLFCFLFTFFFSYLF
jgi:hypothetical protein